MNKRTHTPGVTCYLERRPEPPTLAQYRAHLRAYADEEERAPGSVGWAMFYEGDRCYLDAQEQHGPGVSPEHWRRGPGITYAPRVGFLYVGWPEE